MLSAINIAESKVEISSTHDSYMRAWDEITYGNVPSAGHYTRWSVYIESDKAGWVYVGFAFDNRKEIIKTYVIPEQKFYIMANGYMKTFTNKVNVTIEPPYS